MRARAAGAWPALLVMGDLAPATTRASTIRAQNAKTSSAMTRTGALHSGATPWVTVPGRTGMERNYPLAALVQYSALPPKR
jgi:hypothetical protein